jgi:hypothetical protein
LEERNKLISVFIFSQKKIGVNKHHLWGSLIAFSSPCGLYFLLNGIYSYPVRLDKGKPVVRQGRKVMGLWIIIDRQATEGLFLLFNKQFEI